MLDKVPDFQKIGKQLILDAQTIAEVEMINFVMSNFEKQAWQDGSAQPWPQRNNDDDPGRALLVKNNTLIDSFKIGESSTKRVVLTSTARHAAIHNEGGILHVPITPKSRKFFWAKYRETQKPMFKALALTKKPYLTITIKKRQFMGASITFNNIIEAKFQKMIVQRFKAT
jgi:phage gpG-like protein